MWVASDEHPTHTEYDGTSRTTHCAAGYTGPKPFDECVPGTSYSFTFDKAGTYEYHDHLSASHTGKITVTE
jgi:plastocyanin